jgi:hypothetical protein
MKKMVGWALRMRLGMRVDDILRDSHAEQRT